MLSAGILAPQIEDCRQHGDGNEIAAHFGCSCTESEALIYSLLRRVLNYCWRLIFSVAFRVHHTILLPVPQLVVTSSLGFWICV